MVPCLSIIERSDTLCQAQYSFCEYKDPALFIL
jgi:hypothetical protein